MALTIDIFMWNQLLCYSHVRHRLRDKSRWIPFTPLWICLLCYRKAPAASSANTSHHWLWFWSVSGNLWNCHQKVFEPIRCFSCLPKLYTMLFQKFRYQKNASISILFSNVFEIDREDKGAKIAKWLFFCQREILALLSL